MILLLSSKYGKYAAVFFLSLFTTISCITNAQTSQNDDSKVIYSFPVPGSDYITPQSDVIIRTQGKIDPASINNSLFSVTGSKSGIHKGKVILSSNGETVLFKPLKQFDYGEKVTVKLNSGLKTLSGQNVELPGFIFNTSVNDLNSSAKYNIINGVIPSQEISENLSPGISKTQNPVQLFNQQNLPVNLPGLKVSKSDNPTGGYVFLASYIGHATNYGSYLIIADNSGNIMYYRKTAGPATDFKVQPTGVITYCDEGKGKFYVMNTSFKIIDSVKPGNGYITDAHELRMLPDGNIFLLGDDIETVDMSKIVQGGDTAAKVTGNIIQELDKNKNVIFEWRSWDHFKITDATHENLKAANIDYVHANAIAFDTDGNLLLSSRHMDEITKIDIKTGDIIWRLGGKNNQFTFTNDPIRFSHQHALRVQPNGDITLFDNGNYHTPSFSRAVEYKLDESNKTATLVWQYRNHPDIYGFAMGFTQRLDNGNTFIGWGTADTTVTEVTPQGNIALEMKFPAGVWSYRAFRFPFLFIDTTLAGKTFTEGDSAVISWQSSGIDSIDIDYSTNNGDTWNSIVDDYDANKGNYTWNVPDVISTTCKIRIVNSDENSIVNKFVSRKTFSIQRTDAVIKSGLPKEFSLLNNYPNPFNPSTRITYELPAESKVVIRIYNTLGQLVDELVNSVQQAGTHDITFNAVNLPSGIYFDSIKAEQVDGKKEFSSVKKMILLK